MVVVLALITFGTAAYQANERQSSDTLQAWFFDVGEGDAILLYTPTNQQILIDGGPNSTILTRLGRALPIGDRELDLVIISHNHSDHIRGVIEVLKHYRVKQIWLSGAIHTTDTFRELLETIKANDVPTEAVQAGRTISFGDLSGVVLYPLQPQQGRLPDNQHDANVATYWVYGSQSLFLAGDLEAEGEQALLQRSAVKPTTILKVGHQGSKTSSTLSFLQALQPKIGVIMVGANNSYNLPNEEILKRFQNLSIPILRTDRVGTIRFNVNKDGYDYTTGL